MTNFVFNGVYTGAGLNYISGVTDLEVFWHNGNYYLYSTTGSGGGIAVLSIASSGALSVRDTQNFNSSLMASSVADIEFLTLNGSTRFITYGTRDWSLDMYTLASNGSLGTPGALNWGTGGLGNLSALGSLTIGSTTHVYGANANTSGFNHYTLSSGGTLTLVNDLSPVGTSSSADIVDFETVTVGGQRLLLAASQGTDGVLSYKIASDGTPTEVYAHTAELNFPTSTPTKIATGQSGGNTYAFVASAGSSSLTVLSVDAQGKMLPVDHVVDNLWTRFSGVTEMETIQIGGQLFLVVGGADDGLSLFSVMANGALVHLDTVADTNGTSLRNVSALSAKYIGGKIHIYATSETEAGITLFSVDVGSIGASVLGSGGTDTLIGTTANDVLHGGLGNDNVQGGSGDDILSDGIGVDSLTGGAGSDIFALAADDMIDTITDYNPSQDTIDFSGYFMLYDANQLSVTTTSWGATVTYRNEVLHVFTHNGSSLYGSHFTSAKNLTLDRPPGGFQYIPETFYGTSGDDVMQGNGGYDVLKGLAGNDLFLAGSGIEVFQGGSGVDTVDYGAASGSVYVDFLTNEGRNGAAGDTYSQVENLVGSNHNDTLIGQNSSNRIEGGSGNDRIYGHGGNDTLVGGAGWDKLLGGSGSDILDGGTGNDIASYVDSATAVQISLSSGLISGGAAGDTLISIEYLDGSHFNDYLAGDATSNQLQGHNGNDRLYGLDGNDTLSGGSGNDILVGGNGNDTLLGGNGDDVMYQSTGYDVFNGGAGTDLVSYAAARSGIVASVSSGNTAGGASGDTLISIERLIGSQYSDVLYGNSLANSLYGMSGNDKIYSGAGNDIITGSYGNDQLNGGNDHDYIDGGHGNDYLNGSSGNDRIFGGSGNDTIYAGSGNDYISAGLGNDLVKAVTGNNSIHGGSGNDRIFAGIGSDYITGGSGNDLIYASSGNDRVYGSYGNDTIYTGAGNDYITGGVGADTLIASSGANTLHGDTGNDRIFGGTGRDYLNGGIGHDLVYGRSGDDRVYGGYGNDRLYGDAGNDILSGGVGNDYLVGGLGRDSFYGGVGHDTVSYASAGASVTIYLDKNVGYGRAYGDKFYSIETIIGSRYGDVIRDGTGSDRVFGGSGNDILRTSTGNDFLYGGAGNDILVAGAGRDHFNGGVGVDTLSYASATANVSVNILTKATSGGAAGDTFVSIENLIGGGRNDILKGNQNQNVLNGLNGKDRLFGFKGNDVLYGGDGKDTLFGGDGRDRLYGNKGNDTLKGQNSNDVLHGGSGNDRLYGGKGRDTFIFTDGKDRIKDFVRSNEKLLFDKSLVGGEKTVSKFLDKASINNGNAVFNFGNGDQLTVEGVSNLNQLSDNIDWF